MFTPKWPFTSPLIQQWKDNTYLWRETSDVWPTATFPHPTPWTTRDGVRMTIESMTPGHRLRTLRWIWRTRKNHHERALWTLIDCPEEILSDAMRGTPEAWFWDHPTVHALLTAIDADTQREMAYPSDEPWL